jgi:hypothetical protein
MSDLSSAGSETPGSKKKKVSPLRNAIGLVVLATVVIGGWLQYSAKSGYTMAVNALNERMLQEDKDLLAEPEAESLFGKSPDGPGSDVRDGNRDFTKKTYTWRGLLKSYTLTAFYTKSKNPALHHFETEGAKLAADSNATAAGPNMINEPVSTETAASTAEPSKPATAKAAGFENAKTPEPTAEASKPSATKDAVAEKAPK